MSRILRIHKLTIALFLQLMVLAQTGNATTYIGNRNIGTANAILSITTDGTLGHLRRSNIIDWSVLLSSPGGDINLYGAGSALRNSNLSLSGSGPINSDGFSPLIATPNSLDFDTSFIGSLFINQINIGNYYCIQQNLCFDANGPGEGIAFNGQIISNRLSGIVTIAATNTIAAAVPEMRS